jgi:hypothetical protein
MGLTMNLENPKIENYNPQTEATTDVVSTKHTGPALLTKGISYWPTESLKYGYAMACLEIVLLRSEKAKALYRDIVQSWGLPGCQAICQAAKPYLSNILPNPNLLQAFVQFIQKDVTFDRTGLRNFVAWLESEEFSQLTYYPDFQYLVSQVRELILVGFNRKIDQENKAWKVKPGSFPIVIVELQALFDYYKKSPQDFFQAKIQVNDKIYNLNDIPAIKHTTRERRAATASAVKTFKEASFIQHHGESLLELADHWYQSRVVYSGPEEYCREHYRKTGIWLDSANITRYIAVIDQVTGYPRKWRK